MTLRISLIVTPSSLRCRRQGILLLQLGGGGGQAPAAAAQRQQDPHRGLGEWTPGRARTFFGRRSVMEATCPVQEIRREEVKISAMWVRRWNLVLFFSFRTDSNLRRGTTKPSWRPLKGLSFPPVCRRETVQRRCHWPSSLLSGDAAARSQRQHFFSPIKAFFGVHDRGCLVESTGRLRLLKVQFHILQKNIEQIAYDD